VDDAPTEDIRRTYFEILNQSLSGVASAVSTRVSREISCVPGRSAPPPAPPDAGAYAFEITLGGQGFPLLLVFAPSITGLSAAPVQAAAEGAPEERAQTAGAPRKTGAPGSMDLLLDVELPVSVSFGRAQLMLKDVIKLTTGSIVELNRALSEPVEVIVNNCVIARGEVVVVEGNYGIRIKQVISRQERLRTLY
jgi:flagellar motor switch protein FliN